MRFSNFIKTLKILIFRIQKSNTNVNVKGCRIQQYFTNTRILTRLIVVVLCLVSSQTLVNSNIWCNRYYDFLICNRKTFQKCPVLWTQNVQISSYDQTTNLPIYLITQGAQKTCRLPFFQSVLRMLNS